MKKIFKLSLLSLALAIVFSGCAQKIKPEEKNTSQLPEKATSSLETQASSTIKIIPQPNLSIQDFSIKNEGQNEIVANKKYKFSLTVPASSTVESDYAPVENSEAYQVGDLVVIIATGTVESLNKGFFEEEGTIADDNLLRTNKIAVASGQVGQAFFYDYVIPNYSYHNYSFLIRINDGKNILILKLGYNGGVEKKELFKKIVQMIKIN